VITITAVDRKNSKPVSATLVIRSIENVLREEENQRELLIVAVQRAEAASRAKSDFLSNMSHDIRTPMNAIMGMTAIAEMHIDDKGRVLDALQKITVSGKHLLGLINSVLDMSKIESGTISLQEDPFDLSVTVDGLLSIFHSQIEAKKQKLETDISQITHRKVVGDEQRLQQILINILGNAVKFTPDGGSIFLTVCEKESQVKDRGYYEFIIEDTGIGMEQKFIDKIFEPFTRAADSRTTKIEGSGLGMSIAVNVARMMGGDIQVESELGKGSKFTVNVYLQINNDQNEIPNQAGTGLEESSDLDCHGKRALLVDDNELNLEVAEELLEMLGMTVEKANNGRNAVQAVSERPTGYYDLVFMDVQMPIMNGYEATMAIRSMDRKDLKELPIIAMTADAFADDVRKAEEAGMNGHIAKPVDILKLKKIIKKWIFRDIQN
jgi:signal transduction histidine kinase/ActR/RegA family two-component response regulator